LVFEVNSCGGILLGFTGSEGSGKDSAVNRLVEKYNYKRLSFADNLRSLVYEFNPPLHAGIVSNLGFRCIKEIVDSTGWDAAKQWPEVRRILQDYGSLMRLHLGEDVFIDPLDTEIRELIRAGTNVAISDVRYPNECRRIINIGGKIVDVTKPNMAPVNSHSSAQGLAKPYAMCAIDNSGTLGDLHMTVDLLHESLLGCRKSVDELRYSPDIAIASFKDSVQRAMALGLNLVLDVSAPGTTDTKNWSRRHKVEVHGEENVNSIDIEVDGDSAGNVTYEDGVLTVDAFLAR